MKDIYKSIKESDFVQEQAQLLESQYSSEELFKLNILAIIDSIKMFPIETLEDLKNVIQLEIDIRNEQQ